MSRNSSLCFQCDDSWICAENQLCCLYISCKGKTTLIDLRNHFLSNDVSLGDEKSNFTAWSSASWIEQKVALVQIMSLVAAHQLEAFTCQRNLWWDKLHFLFPSCQRTSAKFLHALMYKSGIQIFLAKYIYDLLYQSEILLWCSKILKIKKTRYNIKNVGIYLKKMITILLFQYFRWNLS